MKAKEPQFFPKGWDNPFNAMDKEKPDHEARLRPTNVLRGLFTRDGWRPPDHPTAM